MAYSVLQRDELVLGVLRFRGGWVPARQMADDLPFSLYHAQQVLERLMVKGYAEFRQITGKTTSTTGGAWLTTRRNEYRATDIGIEWLESRS